MNEAEIAHKILNRRNNVAPVVMAGEMHEQLGADGYSLALQRRWIEPNYDSGHLSITSQAGILKEMRDLAATHKVDVKPVQEKVFLSRLYSTNLESKVIVQRDGQLYEEDEVQIGDSVVVAEEGQPMSAVIKSKNADGTYTLSFGQEKPRSERPYKPEELRKTGEVDPARPPTR